MQWKNYHYIGTDEGIVITKYEGGTGDALCIPSQIGGQPVIEIGAEAFAENGSLLAKIEVPSSVRRIGNGAFKMCLNLTELVLHDGLESIGAEALYLTPLAEIFLPDTLREIEEPWEMSAIRILVSDGNPCFFADGFCLYQRKGAEQELLVACQQEERAEYSVMDGTTVIGESAFAGNETLKRILLPESVHTIRESAFEGCRGLAEVVLPEILRRNEASDKKDFQNSREENRVFFDAEKQDEQMVSADDPRMTQAFSGTSDTKIQRDYSGLRCIGGNAFSHCICLKEIYLPSTVEVIGRLALSDTFGWSESLIGLERITVSAANTHFMADENALFEIGNDRDRYLVKYFGRGNTYRIPEDVTRILPGAFRRAKFCKCRIPKSVRDVGEDAFRECAALEELELEESGLRLYVPRQPVYRKDEITELFYSEEREARMEKLREAQTTGERRTGRWSILEFPDKWKDFAANYPKPGRYTARRQETMVRPDSFSKGEKEVQQDTVNSEKRFVYDYCGYDALFPTYLSLSEKCGMACCRLQCPVQLTVSAAAEYRGFVADNLTDILRDISKMQDIDRLALLAGLGFFTEQNINDCLEVFAGTGSAKCTGFLLNYQRDHLAEEEFDFSL